MTIPPVYIKFSFNDGQSYYLHIGYLITDLNLKQKILAGCPIEAD